MFHCNPQGGKLSTAKKIQSSSCKHLSLVSFVNSFFFLLFFFLTVKVRVLADTADWIEQCGRLSQAAGFFSYSLALPTQWLWNFYSVACIISIHYNILLLTHSYFQLSLHNSFRWFQSHTVHRPTLKPRGKRAESESSYCGALSSNNIMKENNEQPFSVGMDDMLESDKAFTSNILQLFINACKLHWLS